METDGTIRRLKTVEGHLRGVIRMVEEDAYCIDVIRQIQAIEAALKLARLSESVIIQKQQAFQAEERILGEGVFEREPFLVELLVEHGLVELEDAGAGRGGGGGSRHGLSMRGAGRKGISSLVTISYLGY